MFNLIRAEWFKLTRRPMAWVLLCVFLGILLLNLGTQFLAVALHDGALSGGATRISVLREEQVAQFRLMLSFPGIFGAVFGAVNSVGGICAIVLAAGALGSEYNWGTLRTQLARQPQRGRYLVAKIVALLLVLLAGVLIGLLVGALLGLLFGSILGRAGSVGGRELALLPLGTLRALYVMLPYVLWTLACCALGRSVLAGAAGGFLFLILDLGLGTLSFLADLGGPLALIVNLALQQNVSTLTVLNSQSFGLDPAVITRTLDLSKLPSPLLATLVVGLYSALFFFYAHRLLTRRDITGAA
jgi:ABC-2 type transport system permease protein